MFPENFSRIQKLDTAGISSKDKSAARYIAFIVRHFNNRYSLFVFDADKQTISEWLVKEAMNIVANRKWGGQQQIAFSITASDYSTHEKILDYRTGKFILTDGASPSPAGKKRDRMEDVEVVELTTEGPGYSTVEVPRMEGDGDARRTKPAFNPYFIKIKDSLFYLTSYADKHPVKLSAGGQIILNQPRGVTQYQPVIVKNEGQFYIVKTDQPGSTAYDSLIYYGQYFLAWQTVNGKKKAGVIDADGKAIVPMEYDSLYADIKYFNLKNTTPAREKANYIIDLAEADSKYNYDKPYPYKRNYSGSITVFKNGKCGVINMKNEVLIPIEYELIARNNLQHSRPREDEFIILRQHNKYGIAHFKYNRPKSTPDFILIAGPVYDYIPGFYYKDYYGVKDFKLVGLYNEQFELMGYATESGKVFYKE